MINEGRVDSDLEESVHALFEVITQPCLEGPNEITNKSGIIFRLRLELSAARHKASLLWRTCLVMLLQKSVAFR